MTNIAGVPVRTFLLLVLLAVVSGTCPAQNQPSLLWRAGVGIAPAFMAHTASFKSLPGIPQPPAASFFSSSGAPVAIGIQGFIELPLFNWSTIGLLADIHPSVPARLIATELIPVQTDEALVTATITHAIDARLQYMGGEAFAHIPLPDRFGVRLGLRGDFLTGSSFEQTQEITDPDLDFVGFDGRVLSADGELPDAAPAVYSLSGGITYPLDLPDNLQLQLEGGVRVGLTDVVSGVDWTFTAFRASASVVYNRFAEKQRLVDTVYQRDTTLRLVAGLAEERVLLVAGDSTIQETETPDAVLSTITFHRRYVRELPRPQALLTTGLAIRFVLDDGSEAVRASGEIRTVEEIRHVLASGQLHYDGSVSGGPLFGLFCREFAEQQQRALGFTASEMNKRVMQHIRTKAGTRPGVLVTSHGNEQATHDAALRVRKLCSEAWNIPSDVIPVEIRPSADRSPLPVADISIGSGLEPIVLRDTVVLLPVRRVLLYPEIVSEAGIERWELHIRWGDRDIYSKSGEGDVPDTLSWTPNEEMIVAAPGLPIHCVLTVVDRTGQQQNTSGEVFFQHKSRGVAGVDATLLRFILQGRDLDDRAMDYIRRQLKQAGAVPVSIAYWYTAATPTEQPLSVPAREARALGVRSGNLDVYPQVVPGATPQIRRANDIIDIRAETGGR